MLEEGASIRSVLLVIDHEWADNCILYVLYIVITIGTIHCGALMDLWKFTKDTQWKTGGKISGEEPEVGGNTLVPTKLRHKTNW